MGRFELMKCYCYSGGGGGRALRLISGFRHSAAATPGEDYRHFHGGGKWRA